MGKQANVHRAVEVAMNGYSSGLLELLYNSPLYERLADAAELGGVGVLILPPIAVPGGTGCAVVGALGAAAPSCGGRLLLRRRGRVGSLGMGRSSRSSATFVAAWNASIQLTTSTSVSA